MWSTLENERKIAWLVSHSDRTASFFPCLIEIHKRLISFAITNKTKHTHTHTPERRPSKTQTQMKLSWYNKVRPMSNADLHIKLKSARIQSTHKFNCVPRTNAQRETENEKLRANWCCAKCVAQLPRFVVIFRHNHYIESAEIWCWLCVCVCIACRSLAQRQHRDNRKFWRFLLPHK